MPSIIERIKALQLPLDQLVVIGSGLLDAYGLRQASDIDLAVSEALFANLKASGDYELSQRHDEEVLTQAAVEIWRGWGKGVSYEALVRDAVVIDGVRFANPQLIIDWKRRRGLDKDLRDIRLLEGFLREQ